jgi:hypothetical protein
VYFINPSGVTFMQGGVDTQLEMPGSFAVSTADYIGFEDGSVSAPRRPKGALQLSTSPRRPSGSWSGPVRSSLRI